MKRVDGRSTRWATHRERRREELCRAARRAVHQRGPELSMDEMAAAMGTSKSIVYRYFTDKPGLQAAVGVDVLDEMDHALAEAAEGEATPHNQVEAMVGVYVKMLTTSPNVYRYVTEPVNHPSTLTTFLTKVGEYVAVPLQEILENRGEDPSLAMIWGAGMVGFVRGAGEEWLNSPHPRVSPEQLERNITAWLWQGAAPEGEHR
ncbi:MAG TPA: TetR/AcrR family transcriptional regulator [Beutenbergiaceae bacterium]|nr:TetR/AcrR family transcriptional regulator [Beutenbergiaceae bacterium]